MRLRDRAEAEDNAADGVFGRVSSAPGSCGELWQGKLDGCPAHITCPIDIFSEASISMTPNMAGGDGSKNIIRLRRNRSFTDTAKTGRALTAFLSGHDIEVNIDVNITSPLIPGKGMASSTADIIAALSGIATLLNKKTTAAQMAGIALKVDPTDGIFLPGISVFDHHRGRIIRTLGPPPELGIIILDFGGVVDSGTYASANILHSKEDTRRLYYAYEMISAGIAGGDCRSVGEGATISAIVNQKYLPKPALESVTAYAKQLGAYGVNVAHSGAVVGVLVELSYLSDIASKIKNRFPAAGLNLARLIGGGARDVVYDC